jgi:hypothetical protein
VNLTVRRSIAAAAVLLAPLLTSCGFNEPTDRVYNPGVGVNDRSGTVDVLGAVVVSGTDGSGTVVATFVNNDPNQADSVTSIAGSGADAGVSVSLPGPVDMKPGGSVQLSKDTPATAKGASVKPGTFVQLTFSFQRSENVTVQVPVVAHRGDYANVPLSSGSASPSPSESASPQG